MRHTAQSLVIATLLILSCSAVVFAQGRGPRVPYSGGINGGSRGAEFSRAKGNGIERPATPKGRTDLDQAGGQRLADSDHTRTGSNGHRRGPGSSAASGLNHGTRGNATGARGLERAAVASDGRVHQNADRILDKRLEQAEHLEQLGETNGNERLQTASERMAENAQTRYDRRVGERPLPTDVDAADEAPQVILPPERKTSRVLPPPSNPPRNPWLPAWFGGKSGR
ncbi:MAG: hypothetical protein U0939_13910 [Pirellulales bacterium]